MSEILHLVLLHTDTLIIFWIVFMIVGLYMLKKTYYSIFDPIIFQLILAIAPGLSGILTIALYFDQYPEFIYKLILLVSALIAFFFFFWFPFRKIKMQSHEIIIHENSSWQFIVLFCSMLFIILNLIVNGNFEDNDPALRFAHVRVPALNYLSIAISIYPAIIFAFTRNCWVRIASGLIILSITIIQLQAGTSKSFFISFLFIYFYWNYSRNYLQISKLIDSMKRFALSRNLLKMFWYTIFLSSIGIAYVLVNGIADVSSIMIRFVLTFDSPVIFITSSEIHAGSSSLTGFSFFGEVWLKPILKNIIGLNYSFENISQYIAYEMTGYRASTYAETSWQPNNNILIDFLVLHGAFGIVLSGIAGYIIGKVNLKIKSKHIISKWSYPFFVLIVVMPFYLFTDAQSFFTSLILSVFFIYSINGLYIMLQSISIRQSNKLSINFLKRGNYEF